MSTWFIDRRQDGKGKSVPNRQRFIRRYKGQIAKAVADSIAKRGIREIDEGGSVSIPARDLREPTFGHDPKKGIREVIHPGNKEFMKGDRVPRPVGGGGAGGSGGGQASNSGEGEDDFTFTLSREEYLEMFFGDLELPDMARKPLAQATEFKPVRAGFTSQGSPNMLAIVPTFKKALGRKLGINGARKKEIRDLEERLQQLRGDGADSNDDEALQIYEEIERIRTKKPPIFIEPLHDLRFRNQTMVPKPSIHAVMFCIMDVSGSMGEKEKDLAKRFFTLLYLFLKRNYEKVAIVFIRHHTTAKEVDEQEFFYGRETGGTVVSSALNLMVEIQKDRYPASSWNIYAAQVSDGDNWNDDSSLCRNILLQKIMPETRYFAFIETMPAGRQNLRGEYEKVQAACHGSFAMGIVKNPADIYPVFHELFKKRVH